MQVQLTPAQNELLLAWDAAKKEVDRIKSQLDVAKEKEMDLRKQVAHAGITSEDEGTNRVEIGNGFELKNVIKFNYKVTADRRTIERALNRLPDDIADRIIKTKFELSLTEYRNLNPRHKAIIDEIITVEEAAPVVEIVPPKGSR